MDYTSLAQSGAQVAAVERNKVLRNTYFLLALSMLPTVAGALIGINTHFFIMSRLASMLVFFGVAVGFFVAIEKTKNSPVGVFLLLAFTGFMGLWLSQMLQVALKFSNGAQLIGLAALGTAAIFFTMATIATVTKKDFSFLGKFLVVGVVVIIVAAIANMFMQISGLSLAISCVALLIFSAYMLYDIGRIINGGETNYIVATLNIYLDIYNVFVSLLNILLSLAGNRD